ncbi:MAG: LLM class flavin-dependent oxidoreductase [Thaumarchaeota archaeon]|jgi:alkanesulfonate monooxygenase|nr:LLM class flavin-dependent oxidoreductase [Nitrososphaerota archaeon]MDG7041181.1 LLM class flavin-dependent oxidoreductase [Nitrososphaerota archaeon]
MKIGVAAENFTKSEGKIDLKALKDYIIKADELGFESVWTWDHLLLGSKKVFPVLDSLALLSYVSSITKRIRLGTLFINALRDPLVAAKLVSSIDYLSGGRVVLAVAAGWYKKEFEAIGVDFERRGRVMVDNMKLMDRLLGQVDVNYSDGVRKYEHVTISPRPINRIPILMGGYVDAALKRVATYSDGWLSYYYGPGEFLQSMTKVETYARQADRDISHNDDTDMVPIFVGNDKDEAKGKVIAFTQNYMDLPAWSKCSVESGLWGDIPSVINKLREYEKAKVKRVVLIPAFYDTNQLDIIAGKIIPEFG